MLPCNAFLIVLHLFSLQHMGIEMLLQFLISEVDIQLLETIGMQFSSRVLEYFESKYIQNTNHVVILTGIGCTVMLQCQIDSANQPIK